jgi:transposase
MYIEIVPNRTSPATILLRECKRDGSKIIKRTLANISDWPMEQVQSMRFVLQGAKVAPLEEVFQVERSLPHGHVEAVLGMMRKLGMENLISSQACPQRDQVMAMIAAQILYHDSKLADTRLWNASTLAQELHVEKVTEDDLYRTLDWLLARQGRIETKLAKKHLQEGARVFYDVSSSYYEGRTCPLARYGHNRDENKLPIIVYGMMTDQEGRAIAVEVYPGNTGDPKTVPDQTVKLTKRFGLSRVVLVGDRGMLTDVQIKALVEYPGIGWISALRSNHIRALVDAGAIQMTLFDQRNLAEIQSPDYPKERLIVCYNPDLAGDRRRTREALLEITQKHLIRIQKEVQRRKKKPLEDGEIGQKVGKILGKWKMAKHFQVDITKGSFRWSRKEDSIEREKALDGIYVIRTSEPVEGLPAEEAVRQYKNLAQVERVFRICKGMDLLIRPIRHRTEAHVRAHIFLCMLAAYVEWHIRQAWAPILFQDEDIKKLRASRDPVATATPSTSALQKKSRHITADGFGVHSFRSLLEELKTRCKNQCRATSAKITQHIWQITQPNDIQRKALDLLELT